MLIYAHSHAVLHTWAAKLLLLRPQSRCATHCCLGRGWQQPLQSYTLTPSCLAHHYYSMAQFVARQCEKQGRKGQQQLLIGKSMWLASLLGTPNTSATDRQCQPGTTAYGQQCGGQARSCCCCVSAGRMESFELQGRGALLQHRRTSKMPCRPHQRNLRVRARRGRVAAGAAAVPARQSV